MKTFELAKRFETNSENREPALQYSHIMTRSFLFMVYVKLIT